MLYDIVVYIFSSFWRWLGAMMMLGVIASGLGGLIKITINKPKKESSGG